MKFIGTTNEYFEMAEGSSQNKIEPKEGTLSMIWFLEDNSQVEIDSVIYTFEKDQIIFLNAFNHSTPKSQKQCRLLRFNSPFYCIVNHDSEVGCKGLLFFGAQSYTLVKPEAIDLKTLSTVWDMLDIEMKSSDSLQLEMLQMMLKRILILCTRIYKSQEKFTEIQAPQADIVREFNYLVNTHFKEKHTVQSYAELLNKSPKTLSNLFSKLSDKTPLQIIQNRIMLEVRRLLRYSDKPISEIGYEVGFNDIQSFSRFFKKYEGKSPTEFRQFITH